MHHEEKQNGYEHGAITVFLALVFMSLVIFAGAAIDIVRINAADRKVQSALNSSARSVLAGYDKELVGEYGIYGVKTTGEAVKAELFRYLSVNLEERHRGMSFIDIQVDKQDIEIYGTNSLLSNAAFDRQVQEYMKYRTPVYVTDSLIEQLKNMRLDKKVDFAKSEKDTRNKAGELREKASEVNLKLSGIKKKLGDLSAEKLEELSRDISEVLTVNGTIMFEGSKGLLNDYNDSRESTNKKAKGGECIENQSEEFSEVKDINAELTPELERFSTEVSRTLAAVKPMLKELNELERELSGLRQELHDLKEELSDLKENKNNSSDSINGVKEEIVEVKEDIGKIEGELEKLKSRIENEMNRLKGIIGGLSLRGYSLKNETIELDGKKSEEARKLIGEMKDEISRTLIKRFEKEWLISDKEFSGSSLTLSDNFGVMDDKENYGAAMKEDEAERNNDSILKSMEKLAKVIEDAAGSAAGKLNTIEYVMDKYTFLTSKTERSHYFRKGEVEYIISGADTCASYNPIKNTEYFVVTDVLLQVWALRFAIDTLDDFVRSIVIFPPQRLIYAIAEGALDSCMDMYNMLNGNSIPLCPKSLTSIKLRYSDHLRILLLMKPEEEIQRKARQLMQVNIKQVVDAKTGKKRTDFRLGDYNTMISASVKAKVNLFFLPLLKIDKLMPESFEGGRYIIRKQIHVGY